MVRLRPERFSPGTVKKLHARSTWLFQILKRINSNAYVVDLPPDFGISCPFNVEDLVSYRGTLDTPSNPFMDEPTHDLPSESPPLPPFPPKLSHAAENINSILDDQIISTRNGGTQRYLVNWRGRPESKKILGLLRRIFDGSTSACLSIITATSSFLAHTRHDQVFLTQWEMLRHHTVWTNLHKKASCCSLF